MTDNVLVAEMMGSVRVLTMNRPEKRNALNTELTQALLTALHQADQDSAVKVIVLAANGQDFCAGADVTEFRHLSAESDSADRRAELTTQLHKAFRQIKKPLIGAAQGNMMGGGAGMAMACDLLVLSTDANIGYPEVKRGIVPAIVMANLAQQIGPKHAFEMIIRGKPVNAVVAQAMGIANHVVEKADIKAFALNLAQEIAALNTQATCAIKSLFYESLNQDFYEAIEKGRKVNIEMRSFQKNG